MKHRIPFSRGKPRALIMEWLCSTMTGHAQAARTTTGRRAGIGRLKSRLILSLASLLVFWHPVAQAQFPPIPLPGGALVKMVADSQRPYIYAIEAPASDATNGTLLFINVTNGTLVKTLTVGTNPTDIVLSPAGDAVFVINAGSRTISKVDLNSFTLVSEKPISTPNTSDISNPLHLVATSANQLYYTDGAWGPEIYSFDYAAGTNRLVFDTGGNVSPGAGGMVVSPNMNWIMYIWQQYGWSAGYADSWISRLNVQPGGATIIGSGAHQNRDPLDTPILMDTAGNWVFNKVQMVLAGNVASIVNQFSENIYAITPDGSLAFGPTKVFETQGATVISILPFSATVAAVSGDQKYLFRYNPAATNVAVYSTTSLKAPSITQQPTDQVIFSGNPATISIGALGLAPIYYYWNFNGTNFAVTTNGQLMITNVQAASAGTYGIIISNTFGMIASSPVHLTVLDINTAINAALNSTNSSWATGGDMPWFVQTNPATYDLWGFGYPATHDGISAMQSGNTTAGQQSILSTIVNGPATLSFWWQAVSISPSDFLTFLLNGQRQSSIASVNYWQRQTYYLGAGTNLLQWDYETDQDPLNRAEAWLDQVSISPGGTPPFVTVAPVGQIVSINSNATMSVTANGTPPFTYQWRLNGTNISSATNALLTLTNLQLSDEGNYDAVVANAYGSTNSAHAYLNVVDTVEALNATNLSWSSSGDVPWFVETATTYDDIAAMQSGAIGAGQQSALQTTVSGPGTLTFWWNVSSEGVNDYLNVLLNGVEQARIFGVVIYGFYGWQQQTIYLGAGTQTVQWAYTKTDSGVSISGRDSGWLDQVSFVHGGTPPFVTLNPTKQVVLLGTNATLNATALGTPPLNFQWQLNLTNIVGATNAFLSLTNAQFTNEGNYTLVVSNAFGITNTAGAYLNVVDFTESLNATNLTWSSGGDQPWYPETTITHDGIAALQSGAIIDSQQSTVQTTIYEPGTLGFWWEVSSETNNDYVSFSVDGVEQSRISGSVNWQQQTCYLTPGTHTLTWNYSKNASGSSGLDAAWLDQISYVTGATAAFITVNPADQVVMLASNATFTVTAQGTPPINYQWLFNSNNILGATSSTLTITNVQITNSGSYAVYVSNDYGSSASTNATLYLLNVYAWGAGTNNTFTSPNRGQSIVPGNLAGVTAIAAGGYHSLALRSNGRVTAWGYNDYGETNSQTTLTNAAAIAAGLYHSLAMRSNGTVSVWGYSSYSLTTLPTAATNVAAIAAGWYHNLALRSNGTVVAWGAGTFQSSSPYFGQSMVPTNLAGVTAVAAGGYHSLALKADGTVVAWGWNAAGQTNVPVGLSNVVAIAAGGSNSIALKNDGTLVAWGANSYGQTNIPAGLSNVVAISAGAAHNLALKNDGTLVVWGLNDNGQTNMPAGLTNIEAVAAGGYHSLALINVGPIAFLKPPYNQTIYKGSNATLTAASLGAPPMSYQWLHNGTNVVSGTNASLAITDAQFTDAGGYQLVVSNSFGAVTSAVTVLTVNDTAPFFTVQPANVAVLQYSNATFNASIGGLPPLTYQWLLNGAAIANATNAAITLTNAQLINEGNYSLVVSNAYGMATSSNAFLNVIDVPEALGPTNLAWFNPGVPVWFAESTNTYDGFAAAATGPLAYGNQTMLQTYVSGPGKLSFWWSGQQYVTMSFQIDGVSQTSQQIASGSGWRQFTYYLPSTVHALTWTAANQNYSYSTNMGFLDQVVFTPGTTPVRITSQPASQTIAAGNSVTFSLGTTGTPPMTYQWYFNGGLISGATSSSLTLNSPQACNAGSYNVIVNNAGGTVTSSNALLTVTPSAPVITTQPNGAPVMLGGLMTFSSGASGTSPIYYQWQLNNLPIAGATNSSLTLNNVQYTNAGNYSLLASNTVGTALSSNALLFAYSTVDLGATLDNAAITWSTTNVPWFPQTNTTYDGVSAAQSGVISGSQQSTLQGVVTGPAMVIYWWKVSCDSFWDSLSFSVNGTIQSSITGSVDWQQVTNYIGSGSQPLQWNLYPVHGAFAGGTAWVDQVQVIPIPGTPVVITANPVSSTVSAGNSVTLSVSATGTPTLLYQWLFNETTLPGATNATLTLNNVQTNNAGTYAVTVTNDFGFAVSSNATLIVNPSGPVITGQPASQTNVINGSTTFMVFVKGTSPFTYQWYFNTSPIIGGTSNILLLSNVQSTNAGNYSVVISNQYGHATSINASLSLIPSKVIEYWPYNNLVSQAPYTTPSSLGNVFAIAVGALHTMALRTDGTVLVWGNNLYGQTNVPAGLSNVVAIAAGNNHCLVLKADGRLAAWGDNGYGQCSIPSGLSNVVAICSGPTYNLALKSDGTVAGWGNDNNGQTDIPAGLTNVQAIFAGYYNGFARMADSSLVQWGSGPVWKHNGISTQLQIGSGMSNVVGVAAGGFSGWSLQADGTALACGWYDGVGPFTNAYAGETYWTTLVRSQNIYPNIVAMAAFGTGSPDYDYVILLGNNGQITQAGGSSGLGGIGANSIPFISSNPGNVTAIAAGYQHAAALASDGAPHIIWPPISRVAYSGDTVTFSVGAMGRMPLNYQWKFNGTNLDCATNALLVQTNVPLCAAGNYNCIVTNTFGTTTSSNATLTVLRSIPRFNNVACASTSSFGLQLDQLSGHGSIIILVSTNLQDWVPVLTNPPVTGSLQFLDPGVTNQSYRFYRAIEQ